MDDKPLMDYAALSSSSLKMLYDGVRAALKADDEADRRGEPREFAVRETPDWQLHARGLSDEMVKRGMTFSRVDWWGER